MKEFVWAIVVTILLVGSLGGWQYYQLKEARTEINVAFQDLRSQQAETGANVRELSDAFQQSEQQTAATFSQIQTSLGELGQDINLVQQESRQQVQQISGKLQTIQQESEEKISELEERIKINLKSPDFSAVIDDVIKSVVSIQTDTSIGSGAIIETDGYIITNNHVIEGATQAGVRTFDGTVYAVKIIGTNPVKDIAILKIEGTFQRLKFADSDDVDIGRRVIALGSPRGLEFSVNEGIISARRTINENKYFQTDTPINPGNSGGPLVDASGKIVGINNWKLEDSEGLNFAITSNEAKEIADSILAQV